MSYRLLPTDDYWLTEGVMIRRVFAWVIDMLLIGLISRRCGSCCCCSAC